MIPIRDHNPSGKTPFVTYLLMGVNVVVFMVMFLLDETGLLQFINRYALIPAEVIAGRNLETFLTSIFLHGGVAHLGGNMLFLSIFGDNMEEVLGHFKFLLFYLVGGVIASVLQLVFSFGSQVPVLGASGAIAAVMGGYLVLFPRHRIDVLFSFGWTFRQAAVPAYTMLFYWFIFQVLSGVGGLAYLDPGAGGVAFFAHIGGFVFGWGTLKILAKKQRGDYYQ